ncbi:alpha-galactosidase [Microbacterium trichothecenolyticum]|uniref:Alpha-galactosidase n=1 Tax=Microbacterium trichothecenolyticum TaxID=69370 RepID=A0A0M2HJR4_MICTR|nr:alpha-galactosidase [Microbacterium trichothecenolyticum]KJL44583.1 Alpha-galactosidase A precursor [Microbacterium trichothecenolyticum]
MTLRKTAAPPMGWNSWDSYGTTVTEAEVLANAEFMAEHLLPHGWDTVVVDIDWADPTARSHGYNESAPLVIDEFGRVQPDPVRFPSASGGAGFGPLAQRIHELGLKFGIHIMRGIPRIAVDRDLPVRGAEATAAGIADPANVCEWNPHYLGLDHRGPGAAAYYRSLAEQYAQWGVDFIKADDMLWPYQAAEIEALSTAIEAVPREIALSLSPGRDLSTAHLEHLRAHATMWRICDDLWDRWEDVEANFARLARWAPLAGPEGWPDADMLPLGRIGIRAERGEPREGALTLAERRTLVTLWVMARSPLMIGGDLPTSAPETIALFQNDDVLEILRDSHGNRELMRERDLVIWTAERGDRRWVAVFNTADEAREVPFDTRSLGLGPEPAVVVDVWSATAPTRSEAPHDASAAYEGAGTIPVEAVHEQSDDARGVAPGSSVVRVSLEPHGCVLLRA